MEKSIRFLALTILISTVLLCGAWIFTSLNKNAFDESMAATYDRYYFGVSQSGLVNSAVDKVSGKIVNRSVSAGSNWNFK